MCFCEGGGRRVGVGEVDLGKRPFIVANGEELAKLPLARRNNYTAIISIMIPICIDAPFHALSNGMSEVIDLPDFVAF